MKKPGFYEKAGFFVKSLDFLKYTFGIKCGNIIKTLEKMFPEELINVQAQKTLTNVTVLTMNLTLLTVCSFNIEL